MCSKPVNTFFWKGKRVTAKVYNARVRQASVGKNLRNVYGCSQSKSEESKGQSGEQSNLKDEPKVEGRRIVHIKTLGTQMDCRKCNQTLSLRDIVDEKLVGLACIWTVQCQHCLCTTRVTTDTKIQQKNRTTKQGKQMRRYGVNIAGAMGNSNLLIAK